MTALKDPNALNPRAALGKYRNLTYSEWLEAQRRAEQGQTAVRVGPVCLSRDEIVFLQARYPEASFSAVLG